MLKNFIGAIGIVAALLGHIYVCTYTEFPKFPLYFVPLVLAGVTGIAMNGGVKDLNWGGKIVAKDDQGNRKVSLLVGSFVLSLIAYEIFTIIALNER